MSEVDIAVTGRLKGSKQAYFMDRNADLIYAGKGETAFCGDF